MKFPVTFYRQLGGGMGPLLGSDTPPTPSSNGNAAIVQPPVKPPTNLVNGDCVLRSRAVGKDGVAVQRVAVLYGYNGAGTAPALTATLWALEETFGIWFPVGAANTALTVGGLTHFDALPVSDQVPFSGGAPGSYPGQALVDPAPAMEFALIVANVGSINGQYFFGMAPVFTSSP
jgi:hypothetical protein